VAALLFLVALLFPIVAGYIGSYFYPGGFAMAQADNGSMGSAWSIVLLAVIMIAGIFSSFVFEKAKVARADGVPVFFKLSEIAKDFQFIAALFVSPLIFNSVYALTNQNPETLGDYLLAYQNGFFWQTVFAGIAGTIAAPKARANAARGRPRAPAVGGKK
jgi:hypothetical protein